MKLTTVTPRWQSVTLLCLVAVLVVAGVIAMKRPPAPQTAIAGLPQLLEMAESQGIERWSPDALGIFLYTFTRAGRLRESLVLLPDEAFEIEIPTTAPDCVSVVVSMPYNLGDGAVLITSFDDGNVQQQAVRLVLDPAHVREHRAWLPVQFELPRNRSGLRLRFEVGAGIRDDWTADWVGIAPGPETECLFGEPDMVPASNL